ncbi:MAG: hypothetical protein P8H56_10590 [Crocinitomicaceae bacterium]|nr:hypothetical protein [Crocinitomicaceae bacterium]MDG1659022.1 hypothetical protein [Crocinitomicaceae bacterium]
MSLDDSLLDENIKPSMSTMKEFVYPLEFEFKISSLANDFTAKDANGQTVAYVRQKMFKFKEAISVYSNGSKQDVLYTIGADRVIDFNANYEFKNQDGVAFGRVGRRGVKSILKAHYEVFDLEGEQEFLIQEENPWTKFWDALLCEVPLLGMFSGYFFNPRYIVKRQDNTEVTRLSKQASFWGRRFKLEKLSDTSDGEDERILLALMMMTLLERRRG